MSNKCLYCNKTIPDRERVCRACEREEIKMGMILQSLNATPAEVKSAYDFMEDK